MSGTRTTAAIPTDTHATNGATDCVVNTVCGNSVAGGNRLTGADRENAGTCIPCAENAFAINGATDCVADMPRAKYLSTSASELCQSTFELLRLIAVAGRPYKELLCECDVLVQIASIMCGSMLTRRFNHIIIFSMLAR